MIDDVITANVEVHTRMAATYNANEPHFRPENRTKVRRKLDGLRRRVSGGKLLDLGCGTGFILSLACDLFDELHGVDVTQAMLDQVDVSVGNITLHRALAEKLPFPENSFDVVSAYSFIHHTANYVDVLREAYRVLAPGGVLYIDLEPNRRFWSAINSIAKEDVGTQSAIVRREVDSVLHTDSRVQAAFGISADSFRNAEYTKSVLGGIDAGELYQNCVDVGFSTAEVRPVWFCGEGAIMHGESVAIAEAIDRYLRQVGRLSHHLFKYLECIATK